MHVLMAWTWVLELWHAAEESDDIWIKPHPLFKLMLRFIGLFRASRGGLLSCLPLPPLSQVLTDCSGAIGLFQPDLLQEVARVMAKPAKPETDAGKSQPPGHAIVSTLCHHSATCFIAASL